MNPRRGLFTIIIVLFLSQLVLSDSKPTLESVAGKLSCYCGTCPNLPVNVCDCSTAEQIRADLRKKIEAGMTEQQIIDEYVAKYGQTVLSMPPRSGFNLTAWLIPFLGFAVGGGVLIVFLRRQRQQSPELPGSEAKPDQPGDPTDEYYRERLQKELEGRK